MTSNRIFTRQLMGLDYRVWRVMLIISILSVGLLGYRLIESKKCIPVNFSIKTISPHTDSTYSTGETLSFVASANKDEISWDFGDNTAKVTGQYVTHIYQNRGSYKITASTGTNCETTISIVVKAVEFIQKNDNNPVTGEEIIGQLSTITGKEELFTCVVTAKFYEWSITNYPKMTQTGSTAKFKFPTPGKYAVEVTLDHDRTKRYSKEITVEQAPDLNSPIQDDIKPLIPDGVQPLPDPTRTVIITDATFKDYLEKVINKKMTVTDFDNYLCYKGETKAVLNGDLMTFTELCDDISGKKRRKMIIGKTKIKIQVAEMRRDKDGCVNIIEIKYH
jgi:PKD repeat protein